MDGFAACFEGLDDPRTRQRRPARSVEMLMIALCTVLSGGEDCTDMAEFARVKLGFLRGFLQLEHGAPSHDTFSRLFRLLDAEQFQTVASAVHDAVLTETARAWWRSMARCCAARVDKAQRQVGDAYGRPPGARATAGLGQVATDAKSNEITAVPKLLECSALRAAS